MRKYLGDDLRLIDSGDDHKLDAATDTASISIQTSAARSSRGQQADEAAGHDDHEPDGDRDESCLRIEWASRRRIMPA